MLFGLVIFMIAYAAFLFFAALYGADSTDGKDWLRDPYASEGR